MKNQTEIITYAVSMILKAALLAATWAGKARKHGLKSIAKLPIDEKDKEFFLLRDRIYQLETRLKILQNLSLHLQVKLDTPLRNHYSSSGIWNTSKSPGVK